MLTTTMVEERMTNFENASTKTNSTTNRHNNGKRIRLHHVILVTATAFVWMVPWLFIQEIHAVRNPPLRTRQDDTMSNAEVRNYLKIYNAGSTSVIPQSSTTPIPSPNKLSSQLSNSNDSNFNRKSSSGHANFSTTTSKSSSFLPTEVMDVPSTTTAPPTENHSEVATAVNDTVGELFQSLNILHTLLGTNANAEDITSALLPTLTTTTPATTTENELSFDESLQALSLLNSLLTSNNNANGNGHANNAAANDVNNINLGQSNALLASLGLSQGPTSSVGTRQANQLNMGDPLTSSLANLLFGGQSNINNPPTNNQQNFLNFKNTGSVLDSASTTPTMSGVLGLLNTLGQFGGASQSSSLLNFGQTPSTTPNYLSNLFRPSQQQQQAQTPNYLSLLFGNGAAQQQQIKTPAQAPATDFLASLLNGGTGKSAQDVSASPSNNLFGSSNSQPNLFSGLLGSQQQQTPSIVSSLGTIGSGLASIAGTALSGLSGSNIQGKPRVRGMDTRLGLGYRFGPNADAQVVWEVGPQLFTEPLPNEQREQIIAMRERHARRQLQQQQQQVQNLQQQLQQLEEEKRFKELQAEERVRQAAAEAAREAERRVSDMNQEASSQRLRRTNKRHRPYPTWTEILFSPDAPTVESLPIPTAVNPIPMAMAAVPNRPRPKQSGVTSFNPRPTAAAAGALLPQPTIKTKRANSILTTYEKHLMQSQAPTAAQQPAALSRRSVGIPQAPFAMPNNGPAPFHHRSNQFTFSPVPMQNLRNAEEQRRIVRMRQINRRPVPPPPGQRASRDKIRFTKMRSVPQPQSSPIQNPNRLGMPAEIGNRQAIHNQNQFQSRMGVAAASAPFSRNPSPPQKQHARIQRNTQNYQKKTNPEAEDSFIRRNAGPYQPEVMHSMPQYPRRPPPHALHGNNRRTTLFDIGDDGMPTIFSKIRPSVNTVFGLWNHLKSPESPMNRLVSSENMIPSPDKVVPPDSLDTFNCYFCNGDYKTTTKPPLISRPLPPGHNYTVPDAHAAVSSPTAVTASTPRPNSPPRVPSFISKIRKTVVNRITGGGGGPKRDQHQTGSEQTPNVHIGANLTPEQLTNLMSPHLPKNGHDNPYATSHKIKFQSDHVLQLIPNKTPKLTTTTQAPLHVPGVEMFIDIDNGEVSVRKNIGKLTGFEEEDFTTTTPRQKTEEELEEEESRKIFQQVQEYLHNSYEEMKFNQALDKEMKKYKDKLSSGQDEMSHGAVSQMFDVLTKRRGQAQAVQAGTTPAFMGSKRIQNRNRLDLFSNASS